MKILHITYSLDSGGIERFVVDLLNEFSLLGHNTTLCTLRDDTLLNNGFYKSELLNSVNYINLKLKPGFRFSIFYSLYKTINEVKPDVIHCHGNLVNYIFPITCILRGKHFHTIHNEAKKEVKYKLEFWIRNYFFKRNMNVITISKETSNSFKNYYKHNKFSEIVNGRKRLIQSNEFNTVQNYFKELRKTSSHIFLHIARCSAQKNQKMLVKVFNKIINDGLEIKLLIIGGGFNSKLGNEIKKISNNNIIYLGLKSNVADYLYNSDAFCLSSIHEGMPISLIESICCGCIPICTPVGGIINTIKDGENGYLSNSTSELDYYNTIKKYLNEDNAISKSKLINYYNENFSIEKCAEKHLEVYKNSKI
jgi:glycosyltransferase involved in cell wall biosynthesis